METVTKKIDLAARANAYYAKQNEIKKQKAIEFVEQSAIPFLTDLADRGVRTTVINYPENLYAEDIIDALTEKVTCTAKRINGRGTRMYITW